MNRTNKKVQFYELHPQTVKHLKKGHPWVTKDSFTVLFPQETMLLPTQNKDKTESWIFLNDPYHKDIKARYWGPYSNSKMKLFNFWNDFKYRLNNP